jgi:hypothetical protein
VDLKKLSRGEQLIGLFGLLLFVDSLLPWFQVCIDLINRCAGDNGWGTFLSLLGVLVALLMVVQIVLARLANVAMPRLGSLTWGQVHLMGGAAAFVLVLLQLVVGDQGVPRTVWLYLGVLLAAGVAYRGWHRSQEPEVTATTPGPTPPRV